MQVRADGIIDTGASACSPPLWALWAAGIATGENAKKAAYGAAGKFTADGVKIGIEAMYDGRWIDIGVVNALAPDMAWSRDPSAKLQFLLGRDGFFDKFNVCIDEAERAAWIRRAAGRSEAPPHGG